MWDTWQSFRSGSQGGIDGRGNRGAGLGDSMVFYVVIPRHPQRSLATRLASPNLHSTIGATMLDNASTLMSTRQRHHREWSLLVAILTHFSKIHTGRLRTLQLVVSKCDTDIELTLRYFTSSGVALPPHPLDLPLLGPNSCCMLLNRRFRIAS
jgi:hypothetical protein